MERSGLSMCAAMSRTVGGRVLARARRARRLMAFVRIFRLMLFSREVVVPIASMKSFTHALSSVSSDRAMCVRTSAFCSSIARIDNVSFMAISSPGSVRPASCTSHVALVESVGGSMPINPATASASICVRHLVSASVRWGIVRR